MFSKAKAMVLPPHRPYDCAIDLLLVTTPPHNCTYPLSVSEQLAMEEYVDEALKQVYIEPSNSPAFAWFYFVEKMCECL